jgi:hypothetical protein
MRADGRSSKFPAAPTFLRGNSLVTTEIRILSSWKDIANYTDKGVRTVQRWEHELGLPVRRPVNRAGKSMVMLNISDMDAWMESHLRIGAPRKQEASPEIGLGAAHGTLKRTVQTIHELRKVTLALAGQLESTARLLLAQHDSLTMLTVEVSWCVRRVQAAGSRAFARSSRMPSSKQHPERRNREPRSPGRRALLEIRPTRVGHPVRTPQCSFSWPGSTASRLRRLNTYTAGRIKSKGRILNRPDGLSFSFRP